MTGSSLEDWSQGLQLVVLAGSILGAIGVGWAVRWAVRTLARGIAREITRDVSKDLVAVRGDLREHMDNEERLRAEQGAEQRSDSQQLRAELADLRRELGALRVEIRSHYPRREHP